jgi:hypothetical protein
VERGQNAAVAIFAGHRAVETAVLRLNESGFDMRKVSVAGRDEPDASQVIGYYHRQDGIRYWGRLGQFWGTLWGLLTGWAFFAVPDLGPVLVTGPLAGWTVAILENAVVFGGLTALGAGLYNVGIPKETVLACEDALRAGGYVVLVHGATGEVSRAKAILAAPATPDAPNVIAASSLRGALAY